MDRRTFLKGSLQAGLFLLAACNGKPVSTPSGDRSTGVERLRLAGGPWGYPSPFAYVRGPGLVHVSFIFDALLWKDATGEMIPWLASEWERSTDGLEWTFRLRDGVEWHDGEALTADDVAFTFDYLTKGPGRTAPGILGFIPVKEVAVDGPSVAVIRLERPFAPFEETVAGRVPIIPEHIWSGVSDPAQLRGPEAIAGSGPYRLESWDQASGSYLYTANDGYFLGRPHVRRLEFVPAPDQLLALQRGEIDSGAPGLEQPLPDEALAPFEDPAYGKITAPGEWSRVLHFNLAKGFPFDDTRFRQAVAYAIDRRDLLDRILFGRGEIGSMGGLAPSHPWVAPDLPAYGHDPGKAMALLDEIGLVDADGDGVRNLPDGTRFNPELQTSSQFSPKTAEIIREYLGEVGIDVRVQNLDPATADEAASEGRYEMALIGYGGFGGDPDYLRIRLSKMVPAGSFTKIHGYDNPDFEKVAAEQLATLDEVKRESLVKRMQHIVAQDVPAIPLYLPTRMEFFRRDVFDAWYFTPGGVFGGYPGTLNKHVFVTGKQTGF